MISQKRLNKIYIENLGKKVGTLSARITNGSRTTRIDVNVWNGPTIPKNSNLQIYAKGTTIPIAITTTGELKTGDRNVNISEITPSFDIDSGSRIVYNESKENDRMYKQYNSTHVHFYHTGTTHGNDLLPTFTQFNWNFNTGSVLTDNISKPNRWGSQFAVYNASGFENKIEKIIMHGSSNGTINEDWALRYWRKPIDENGTSNTNMNLITTHSCTSQDDQNYVFSNRYDPTTKYELNENDTILISFLKTGTKQTSSVKFYADIEIITSYYM